MKRTRQVLIRTELRNRSPSNYPFLFSGGRKPLPIAGVEPYKNIYSSSRSISTQNAQFPINNLGKIRGVKLNQREDQTDKLAEGQRCYSSFYDLLAENTK